MISVRKGVVRRISVKVLRMCVLDLDAPGGPEKVPKRLENGTYEHLKVSKTANEIEKGY